MNKQLHAEMVKDGYVVKVIDTFHVRMIQDVYAIARYNGLVASKLGTENKHKIYAD